MDYRYSTTITTTPFLQKESSKTFLNVHHYLKNSQINNIITQKIYSLHFSKKLINKHPISIIPKKKKKEKKIIPQKCVSRLSRRISRHRSINRKRPSSAREIRATNRPTMERPISRYRFDETSKTAMRFIAVEVDLRQRRRGSFFIIPR